MVRARTRVGGQERAALGSRRRSDHIELDNRHTWFMPGMTCIKVFDLGERRAARKAPREDLATITRVADALPNIDGVCIACKDVAHSDIHGEIDEFAVMARQHHQAARIPVRARRNRSASVIEMAAAIRGGREALPRSRIFCRSSRRLPLNYAETHIDQVIMAARGRACR